MSNEHLNSVWKEKPEYIRRFYDNLEINEKLCQEIQYILKTEINRADIEIAQVSSRAKTLESFCEKISRKNYKNPFDEVTDFSGVRVVYLYSTNRKNIEEIIEHEFEVIEKVDKVLIDEDKFGYGAFHFLVKLKDNQSGARYDELKNKTCEIQVRTILQDAWALIAHHLSYKQESDVPKELKRKLNALSGLFETADDQFENIKNVRLQYQSDIQAALSSGKGFANEEEANIDALEAYLESKFPFRLHRGMEGISDLLDDLKSHGYKTLTEIDSLVDNAIDTVYAKEEKDPPSDEEGDCQYSTVGLVRTALVFMSNEFSLKLFGEIHSEKTDKFRHLIKS